MTTPNPMNAVPEEAEVTTSTVPEQPNDPEDAAAAAAAEAKRQQDASRLSAISQQYDRGNKGYLDPTEKKLREMDTENQGTLDINKVYALMQDFQQEQKKASSLRAITIALAIFAVLLCLANIGTSFAAAVLAKDVTTDPSTGVLISTHDASVLLATTSQDEVFDLDLVIPDNTTLFDTNSSDRRYLQITNYQLGDENWESGLYNYGYFTITQKAVNKIMKFFCASGGWPSSNGVGNFNCQSNNVLKKCGSSRSRIRLDYGCDRNEVFLDGAPYCYNTKFMVTKKVISNGQGNANICRNQFGSSAEIADWNDILKTPQNRGQFSRLLEELRIKNDGMNYFLTRDGNFGRNVNGAWRDYYVTHINNVLSANNYNVDGRGDLELREADIEGGRLLCKITNNRHKTVQFNFRTRSGNDLFWMECSQASQNDDCKVFGPSC